MRQDLIESHEAEVAEIEAQARDAFNEACYVA